MEQELGDNAGFKPWNFMVVSENPNKTAFQRIAAVGIAAQITQELNRYTQLGPCTVPLCRGHHLRSVCGTNDYTIAESAMVAFTTVYVSWWRRAEEALLIMRHSSCRRNTHNGCGMQQHLAREAEGEYVGGTLNCASERTVGVYGGGSVKRALVSRTALGDPIWLNSEMASMKHEKRSMPPF